METKTIIPALEAVLFASGEPISLTRLIDVFETDEQSVLSAIHALRDRYAECGSGLEVLDLDGFYQISTAKQHYEFIKKAFDMRRRTPLSQAALEVLAVIAYNQPVTKSFVEQVRGVDCSGVITTLIEKELIEEKGRLELPGRPLLYGTTKVFLRSFSLNSLSDMPKLPKEQNPGELAEQLPIDETENKDLNGELDI